MLFLLHHPRESLVPPVVVFFENNLCELLLCLDCNSKLIALFFSKHLIRLVCILGFRWMNIELVEYHNVDLTLRPYFKVLITRSKLNNKFALMPSKRLIAFPFVMSCYNKYQWQTALCTWVYKAPKKLQSFVSSTKTKLWVVQALSIFV